MASDDAPPDEDESTAKSAERIRHQWSESDHPSTAVIEAVAATTDRDPTGMTPLYDHVDPDALNALITPRTNSTTNAIAVSFIYDGVEIRIDSSGWVEVQPDGADRE